MQREKYRRILEFLKNPPRWLEILLWVLVIASAIGIRVFLIHRLPVALWSKDAGSYANSAFHWVHTGQWATDPRRGAIYSLLIAACTKATDSINSVMVTQHALGAIAVIVAIIALRAMCGRAALIPFALCSYAYAVYGLPIYLEQLIRNETLLFFFSSIAFSTWLFEIKWKQPHWLWLSGISAGLCMLTKPVFHPFAVMVVVACIWLHRRERLTAVKRIAIFIVAFALPFASVKMLNALTIHNRPPEPQAGILLYGRTAQFTDLEGGIEPEIKGQIRDEILYYRQHLNLGNNWILKQSVVPHLQRILYAQGKLPADLEKLCKRLAFEAIKTHKLEYAKQVLHDLNQVNFKQASRVDSPKYTDLASAKRTLVSRNERDPLIHVHETTAVLDARMPPAIDAHAARKVFSFYHHWANSAWLFRVVPVFLTTLILPLLVFFRRDETQPWWLGAAALWFFTMVLLCTVGRPLDRYVIPVVPVMFWTLSAGVIFLWERLLILFEKKIEGR